MDDAWQVYILDGHKVTLKSHPYLEKETKMAQNLTDIYTVADTITGIPPMPLGPLPLSDEEKKGFPIVQADITFMPSNPRHRFPVGTIVQVRPDSQNINSYKNLFGQIETDTGRYYCVRFRNGQNNNFYHSSLIAEWQFHLFKAEFEELEKDSQIKTLYDLKIHPFTGMKVVSKRFGNDWKVSKKTVGMISEIRPNNEFKVEWGFGSDKTWEGKYWLSGNHVAPFKLTKTIIKKSEKIKKTLDDKEAAIRKDLEKISKKKEQFIKAGVHDFLARRLAWVRTLEKTDKGTPWYFPEIFVLGCKSGDVITHAILLPFQGRNGGCSDMPTLNRKQMVQAYTYFAKNKIIPIGIAKVGQHFNHQVAGAGSGSVSNQVAIFINFNQNGVGCFHYKKDGSVVWYTYLIKKGGNKKDCLVMDENGLIKSEEIPVISAGVK